MRGSSLVCRGCVLQLVKALTLALLERRAVQALLVLVLSLAAVSALAGCVRYLYSYARAAAEVLLGLFGYVYIHEVAQFLLIGTDVQVEFSGSVLVLRALGEPQHPRLAVAAGLLLPLAVGIAALPVLPLFALVVLAATLMTFIYYLAEVD